MSEKMFKEHPRIMEYIQGAAIANAPTLLLFVVLSFVDPDLESFIHPIQLFNISLPSLSVLTFLFITISTVIAGFLVAGRVSSHHVRTGVYTGAFSYLFFIIYKLFFYPSGILTEAWMFIVFLIVGGLGGSLRRLLYK